MQSLSGRRQRERDRERERERERRIGCIISMIMPNLSSIVLTEGASDASNVI